MSEKLNSTVVSRNFAGTLRWTSPEALDSKLTKKVDVWALGCIVLYMVSGKIPYEGIMQDAIIKAL